MIASTPKRRGTERGAGSAFDVFGEVVEGLAGADLVEFGIPAAGLAHGPDWRPFDRFAAGRAHQKMFRLSHHIPSAGRFGFTPTYKVAMPNVSGSYFTPVNPCARSLLDKFLVIGKLQNTLR